MMIKLQDAEENLSALINSVSSNPLSWMGWFCVHTKNPDYKQLMQDADKRIAAETVLENYLMNMDGSVFFCHETDIYVISKDVDENDLRKIAFHIDDMMIDFKTTTPVVSSFDLYYDQDKFVNFVLRSLKLDSQTIHNDTWISQMNTATPSKNVPKSGGKLSRKKRVLLVEDDPITRWIVRRSLQTDCMIAMASGTNKAYGAYQSYKPDIVFLDINLPDGSGYDVLKWILKNDPGAFVVMFSASDDVQNISQALENGARGFIRKPFIKDNLMEYVYRCAN